MKFIMEAPEALNLMLNKLNLCPGLGLLAQMWPWISCSSRMWWAISQRSNPSWPQVPAPEGGELVFGYPGVISG